MHIYNKSLNTKLSVGLYVSNHPLNVVSQIIPFCFRQLKLARPVYIILQIYKLTKM